jgi:predicted DNA-binding transcriptional regulator AlpA
MKVQGAEKMAVDELLTIEQTAQVLGVSPKTLHNKRSQGRGPLSFRVGKRIMYRRSDLDAYLESARVATLRGGEL